METDERFTPRKYLVAVKKVLGDIDLDPFSSYKGNERVKAQSYFSKDHSAYEHEWIGKVFVNPPYSRGSIAKAVTKLLSEYDKRNVSEAILLVPNWTERKWFQDLLMEGFPVCFTNHRIDFLYLDNSTDSFKLLKNPENGSCFFYLGVNPRKFIIEFSEFGMIINNNSPVFIPQFPPTLV